MKTSPCIAALLFLALPLCAKAQSAGMPINPPPWQDASHIAGSIYPTVAQPASARPASTYATTPVPMILPATTGSVTAICMSSSDNATGCKTNLAYAPGSTPLANMAFCDMQNPAFSRCLAHYAHALVKQPKPASRVVSRVVRDAQGASQTVIVLAAANQTSDDINKLVAHEIPGSTVVDANKP